MFHDAMRILFCHGCFFGELGAEEFAQALVVHALAGERDAGHRHDDPARLDQEVAAEMVLVHVEALELSELVEVSAHVDALVADGYLDDFRLAAGVVPEHHASEHDDYGKENVPVDDGYDGAKHGNDAERPKPVRAFFAVLVFFDMPDDPRLARS